MDDDQLETSASLERPAARRRGQRRLVRGTVVSDRMEKTICVREERIVRHGKYGKYVRRRSTYKAHDEGRAAKSGDLVEIAFCRPISKTKCWRLVRVLERKEAIRLPEENGEEGGR